MLTLFPVRIENSGEILRNMRSAVDAFVGEAEQFDDLTMMCVEYKGCPELKKDESR